MVSLGYAARPSLGTRQAWRSSQSVRRLWRQSSCSRSVLAWLLVEASGSAPSRRPISRLDDISMRESQEIAPRASPASRAPHSISFPVLLKMTLNFRSALLNIQFYSRTVVKPSVRFRREALVPLKCACRRVPGPGARSRSSTTCIFETR